MSILAMFVAFMSGCIGLAFLFAAGITFSSLAEPPKGLAKSFWFIDFSSRGVASIILGIQQHWDDRKDLRILTFRGLAALVVCAISIYIWAIIAS